MGAGKSTLGRRLAGETGIPFIDLDTAIEEYSERTVEQWFEQSGEMAFREMERKVLQQSMKERGFIMATGGGTPCFFDNMALMNASGITVYLKASAELLGARLAAIRSTRPLLAAFSEKEWMDEVKRLLALREPWYAQSRIMLSAEAADRVTFAEIIQAHA